MGNYENIESDFVNRTMQLIHQYDEVVDQFEFKNQFNYTLLINCLLGLIVLPKEKIESCIPKERITTAFKESMGLKHSYIHEDIKYLRELIRKLRHSIAHFDISVISESEENYIDRIEFRDTEDNEVIHASLKADEIKNFLEVYSQILLENLSTYRK